MTRPACKVSIRLWKSCVVIGSLKWFFWCTPPEVEAPPPTTFILRRAHCCDLPHSRHRRPSPRPPDLCANATIIGSWRHTYNFRFLPLPSSTSNSIKIMSGVVVLVCGAKPIQIHWKPGGWLGTHPELAIFLQLYSLSCTYFFVTNLTENSRQQFWSPCGSKSCELV